MPDLDTTLHLDMLEASPVRRSRLTRALRAAVSELLRPPVYGMEWGDPETIPPLDYFRRRFVLPYVRAGRTALEIGPGGGRWTRYLLGFDRVYVVDYHPELLAQLRRHIRDPKVVAIANNGNDFPGVPERSVHYLLSFGVLVHLDDHLIRDYLRNLGPVLAPDADVVLQYADQDKVMARSNRAFADNDPRRMRAMVEAAGYRIVEEDTTSLWHSSVIRFKPAVASGGEAASTGGGQLAAGTRDLAAAGVSHRGRDASTAQGSHESLLIGRS